MVEDRRGFRRGRVVPALFTLLVVAVCAGLGVWQVERLHWKEGLIAQREAALAAPPGPPPRSLPEARALEYHRVIDDGVFLHDKELFLNATGPEGGGGFDVVTPLREAGGRVVFVNRGFIPTELKDRAKRAVGEAPGPVRISGFLRLPPEGKPGWFLPDSQPDRNFWFWVDLPAMAAADGLDHVAPFYIAADTMPNPGGWPKGGAALPALPNNHLQYAITWFSLAVAAIVIYVLSQRQQATSDRATGDDHRIPRA